MQASAELLRTKPDGKGQQLFLAFNASGKVLSLDLPAGTWDIHISDDRSGTKVLAQAEGTILVAPLSATVLTQSRCDKTK